MEERSESNQVGVKRGGWWRSKIPSWRPRQREVRSSPSATFPSKAAINIGNQYLVEAHQFTGTVLCSHRSTFVPPCMHLADQHSRQHGVRLAFQY